jgi:hypothetical protein
VTDQEPPWDLIDLDAAKRLVLAGRPVEASARTADGACAVAVARDDASGWFLVVAVDGPAQEATVVALLAPDDPHVQLAGSIAPAKGVGPRIHYGVARTSEGAGLRLRRGSGEWIHGAADPATGWALVCYPTDDFFDPVRIEISTANGAWEPLAV